MYSLKNQMSTQTKEKLLIGYFLFNYPSEMDFIEILQKASKRCIFC